jgi:hypothetical protein
MQLWKILYGNFWFKFIEADIGLNEEIRAEL